MARDRAARREAQDKAKGRARSQLQSFGHQEGDLWLSDARVGRRANHGSFQTPEPWRAEMRLDRPVLSVRAAVAEGTR